MFPRSWFEERSASSWREEYRRKVRIACQAWNVHRALWPELKRAPPLKLYGYVSHRLLKWLLPYTLLGASPLRARCIRAGDLGRAHAGGRAGDRGGLGYRTVAANTTLLPGGHGSSIPGGRGAWAWFSLFSEIAVT